jgi:hypothetical protein
VTTSFSISTFFDFHLEKVRIRVSRFYPENQVYVEISQLDDFKSHSIQGAAQLRSPFIIHYTILGPVCAQQSGFRRDERLGVHPRQQRTGYDHHLHARGMGVLYPVEGRGGHHQQVGYQRWQGVPA